MKRLFQLVVLAVVAVMFVTGCEKFDDSDLRRQLQELREKMDSLEAWCSSSQSAIDAVSILQDAVNNKNNVESITPFIEADGTTGYIVTFTNKDTIKLYNGKAGDTFFGNVVVNDDCIIFTLADGRTFTIPRDLDYLAFEAVEAGATVSMEIVGNCSAPSLEFSTNKKDWTGFDFKNPQTITLEKKGDKVYFRNTGLAERFSKDGDNYIHFSFGEKKVAAKGNIMSLVDSSCTSTVIPMKSCFRTLFLNDESLVSAPELPATTLTSDCYRSMFNGCSSLAEAPSLPATKMENSCYYSMFNGCSSLVEAPSLPATELANTCYFAMFYGCSSLEEAPELPATSLTAKCYYQMFTSCSSLKKAPALPATDLTSYCYYAMFTGCESLKEAPVLPAKVLTPYCYFSMFMDCKSLETVPEISATTLAENCCTQMFTNCTSLETAPELPAINLTDHCYYNMFYGCSSLKNVPALPAETLAPYCYYGMFYGCSSLENAPELPVTDLAPYCYTYMFSYCRSLKEAPALPATVLSEYCYAVMFAYCTSLEKAPELPADHLVLACYESLFEGCRKLDHVKVGFTGWGDGYPTRWWLNGVATNGSFEGPEVLGAKYGQNYIPVGWTFNGRASI